MLSGFHFLSAGGIARQVSSHDFLKVELETAGGKPDRRAIDRRSADHAVKYNLHPGIPWPRRPSPKLRLSAELLLWTFSRRWKPGLRRKVQREEYKRWGRRLFCLRPQERATPVKSYHVSAIRM